MITSHKLKDTQMYPVIDSSLRYHKKHWTVYLKFEIKLNCDDMLLGYKGSSQLFDIVIWFINHIIVILLAKICMGMFK